MNSDLKAVCLKWFLRLSAILQIVYYGLSHVFFPGWYLRSIGGQDISGYTEYILLFMNEIGVLCLGIGIATWIAASNPVRYFGIIVMLYIVSLGSIGVSLYHVLVLHIAAGEWSTIVIISVQVAILTYLIPWRQAISREFK